MRWEMRFFFLAKEKKTFLSTIQRKFFALSFLLSLCLSFSLSLSLFVRVIFEGRRERDCFSAAVLLQLLSSLSRGCVVLACLCSFSFLPSSVCLRVSFKRKWRREKRTKEEKKDQKETDLSFFLSLNQISTKTHHANTKKTSERSTTAATDSF